MKIFSYKSFVVVLFSLFFYTGMPAFLFTLKYSSHQPFFWKSIFAVTVLVGLAAKYGGGAKITNLNVLKPVFYWICFFLGISLLWLIFMDQSTDVARTTFLIRLSDSLFLFLYFFVLYDDKDLQTQVRWVLFIAVLIAIFNNIYDIIRPFTFVPFDNEYSNPGRAAGIYMNANEAGVALVLGMIFTAGLFARKFRAPYVFLVFIGVLTTFSRGAILGWFLVSAILSFQNILNWRQMAAGICLSIIALPLMLSALVQYDKKFNQFDGEYGGVNIENVEDRIEWFFNPVGMRDFSVIERENVAELSWQMFTERPLLGNGLGSTVRWNERSSTHNMYLSYLADHGITGALIFPLLMLALVWKARGLARQVALPYVAFVLFWSLFSHNVIEESYFLISFGLMASMTAWSRLEDADFNTVK
jgi:hypothetical protein